MTLKKGPAYGMLLGVSIILNSCAESCIEITPKKNHKLPSQNNHLNSYQQLRSSTFFSMKACNIDSITQLKKTISKESDHKKIWYSHQRKKNCEINLLNTLAAKTFKKNNLLQPNLKSNHKISIRQAEEKFTKKDNPPINEKTPETSASHTITTYNQSLHKQEKTNTIQITQHRTYYIFASKKELDKNKFSDNKNTILDLHQKKIVATTKHIVLTDIDYILSTNIYVTSQKPKILSTHPKSSYNFKIKGNACVLQIKNPHLFWSKTKILVVEK